MTRLLQLLVLALLGVVRAFGQELEPGAYSPSPVGMNIAVVALTYNTGELTFDPSGPIDNARADILQVFQLAAGNRRVNSGEDGRFRLVCRSLESRAECRGS